MELSNECDSDITCDEYISFDDDTRSSQPPVNTASKPEETNENNGLYE